LEALSDIPRKIRMKTGQNTMKKITYFKRSISGNQEFIAM
jgi:hypothetical protein